MRAACPRVTVLITTRNRKDDLRTAITSCMAQTEPVEILVVDDGSTDGTSEMVKAEFPGVRVERSEQTLGLVLQRNRGARLVTTPFFIILDDDAHFESPKTVSQTLRDFDHPRIAIIDIPMLNFIPSEKQPLITTPEEIRTSPKCYVKREFHGGVSAFRHDVFMKIGGLRDEVMRQGEERDLSLRLLNAGYVVRAGTADLMHHHPSPNRDFTPWYYYGRRSEVLLAWWNTPMPQFLVQLAGVTVQGLISGLRRGYFVPSVKGLLAGYAACITGRTKRAPVGRSAYRVSRILRKRGFVNLDDIEKDLPPMQFK
jgi:GT2 family glycosyltransferase